MSITSFQSIILRRKSKVHFKSNTTSPAQIAKPGMLGAIIGNFGSLGYVIDPELLDALSYGSEYELKQFYSDVMPLLMEQVGAWYNFKPMYPNFPDQVANASDEELYGNAILHYFGDWIDTRIMPVYDEEVRFPFVDSRKQVRFLGLASMEEVEATFKNILTSKASPSSQDKEDIEFYFNGFYFSGSHKFNLTDKILFQNKERMCFTLGLLLKKGINKDVFKSWWCAGNIKTATDVLRLAVAFSNGDVSLEKNTKFGKFPRPTRRLLLELLADMPIDNVKEDLKRHEGAWIRLAEKLHPGEFKPSYQIRMAFKSLRGGFIKTTNSAIELGIKNGEIGEVVELLKTRPGDFARRLNAILSRSEDKLSVLAEFKSVVDKVSTPVLWQLLGYFKSREAQMEFRNRIFLPKTPVALVSENNLIPISKNYTQGLVNIIRGALNTKYSVSSPIPVGSKVYVDPTCDKLLIPSGNRSASTALRQVARGSRFQLDKDVSTVRLFVYWKDLDVASGKYGDTRVDLDLSAIMFDKEFKFLGHCSWTQLRNGRGDDAVMVHSGDITSAPEGAAEFLDINMSKLDPNVAYIACNVYCYTGQKMNELNIGYCGWMSRESAGSGEIFEPQSVEQRADLTADATSTTPMILDVASREIVWADLTNASNGGFRAVHNTMDKSVASLELATRLRATRCDLYDLFTAHVTARNCEYVTNPEDADFIIREGSVDLSPYDIAKITSEFL